MVFGKDADTIARRREFKDELVQDMAYIAIRCKNGGRTLKQEESAEITDFLGRLVLRAREDAEIYSVLTSAKGCRNAPEELITQNIRNLHDFICSVASGGCGETFAVDLGRWAKHIVVSNPDNASLQNTWHYQDYEGRMARARREGEDELASYLKRPAQRQPEDLREAQGYLAYWAGDARTEESDWNDLRETVGDAFEERAKADSYLASMLRLWRENLLQKFTYEKALKMCSETYPGQAPAKVRLENLREKRSAPSPKVRAASSRET